MSDLLEKVDYFLSGKHRYLWPDWRCTKETTEVVHPARKRLSKGKEVAPLEEYSFHTPFSSDTDGNQWVFRADIRVFFDHAGYRATSLILLGLSLLIFVLGVVGEVFIDFIYGSLGIFLLSMGVAYKARTGGEDTWVVLDRTAGNVCFWEKNEENSLTVPFEQVKCYWVHAYQRGGHSYHFVLMPEVALPNERARWWPTLMGFPLTYQQAQYFWRVLCDFMDPNGTVPEVPGLVHQVRACERLGYTIEDITEGGKTIPEEVYQEVAEEIDREFEALKDRLEILYQPEHFDPEEIGKFIDQAPVFFKGDALKTAFYEYKSFSYFFPERLAMRPEFIGLYSTEEYENLALRYKEVLQRYPNPYEKFEDITQWSNEALFGPEALPASTKSETR